MLDRRRFIAAATALGLAPVLAPGAARAHHGWSWAEDEEFTLEGVIRGVRLGNPHGELDVEAGDGVWIAEIGQPWRNDRAGLTEALLAPGTPVTLEGHRSRDPEQKVMKAERIVIAGKRHDLYPERA